MAGSGLSAILSLLLAQIAGSRGDLAATDALILDVTADGLAGEAGADDKISLPDLLDAVGRVEGRSEAGYPLGLRPNVGQGLVQFGHRILRVHQRHGATRMWPLPVYTERKAIWPTLQGQITVA
jgi:hypothetical protein